MLTMCQVLFYQYAHVHKLLIWETLKKCYVTIGLGIIHRLRFHTSYPDSDGQEEKGGTVHFGKVSWLPKLFCIFLIHPCLPNNNSTSGLDSSPHSPHLLNIHYPTYILFYLCSSQELLINSAIDWSWPWWLWWQSELGNQSSYMCGWSLISHPVSLHFLWTSELHWVFFSPFYLAHLFFTPQFHCSHMWQATWL